MPTPLESLYRFFEYSNDSDEATWAVTCGLLEGNTRYYRIMYDGGEKKEWELTFAIGDSVLQTKIFAYLCDVFMFLDADVSKQFAAACVRLATNDPWLVQIYEKGLVGGQN